jgi:hypothetical protein
VNQLGVEETLVMGRGLEDLGLKSVDALLVERLVVETRGAGGGYSDGEKDGDGQWNLELHETSAAAG